LQYFSVAGNGIFNAIDDFLKAHDIDWENPPQYAVMEQKQ